jgi:hypothetical protein
MEEKCKTCNSLICEITLFNGETKHFCSTECVKTDELIECFRNYIQTKIDKYQYVHKEELINFLCPPIKKKIIKGLISEVLLREYFIIDHKGFIYQKDKVVRLPKG